MLIWPQSLGILVLALLLDALIGDPRWLWARMPHPVVLMGKMIDALERILNASHYSAMRRRLAGVFALMLLAALASGIGLGLEIGLRHSPFGFLGIALLASTLLAQRSLYQHVSHVYEALKGEGLEAGRLAVARIVGRDATDLDEAAICRAAIESCMENFSDGAVAPAFWFALFGLPGLILYKIVNTADSMIGHRTPRYEAFGWASARFDDVLNLVPARLSGLFVCLVAPLAGGDARQALSVMWAEAGHHRSPNAGWPESAAAGALDVALLGPRSYEGHSVDDLFFNAQGRVATPNDIRRALRLFLSLCGVQILLYAALALSI